VQEENKKNLKVAGRTVIKNIGTFSSYALSVQTAVKKIST